MLQAEVGKMLRLLDVSINHQVRVRVCIWWGGGRGKKGAAWTCLACAAQTVRQRARHMCVYRQLILLASQLFHTKQGRQETICSWHVCWLLWAARCWRGVGAAKVHDEQNSLPACRRLLAMYTSSIHGWMAEFLCAKELLAHAFMCLLTTCGVYWVCFFPAGNGLATQSRHQNSTGWLFQGQKGVRHGRPAVLLQGLVQRMRLPPTRKRSFVVPALS